MLKKKFIKYKTKLTKSNTAFIYYMIKYNPKINEYTVKDLCTGKIEILKDNNAKQILLIKNKII